MKNAVRLLVFGIFFLFGVYSAYIDLGFVVGSLIVCLCIWLLYVYTNSFVLVVVLVLGFASGWLRFSIVPQVEEAVVQHILKQTDFVVVVTEEVERRVDKQRYVVSIQEPHEFGGVQILITSALYPEIQYGDVLHIYTNRVEEPEEFAYQNEGGYMFHFDYKTYLQKDSIYFVIYYPKILEHTTTQSTSLYSYVLRRKKDLITLTHRLLPEPESSFLAALLWGSRDSLDSDLIAVFNSTGITHIVALSGFNITIVGVLLFLLLPWLYISRQIGFWIVLSAIWLFVAFAGFQSSVTRAAIMGSLTLYAYYIGRPAQVLLLVVLAAVVMTAINPYVLVTDVGFQLSFLATLGLMHIAPMIIERLPKFLTIFSIREVIATTLAAIIATLPLTMYTFGRISLVAVIANIMIVPVVPIVMASGACMLAVSFASMSIAKGISYIVWIVLYYIKTVASFLGSWTYSEVFFPQLSVWIVGGMYICIVGGIVYKNRKIIYSILRHIYEY